MIETLKILENMFVFCQFDLLSHAKGTQIDIDHCSFLVDSYFPGTQASSLEPNYIEDTKTWELLQCEDFLDASRTSLLGRTLWLPNLEIIPPRHLRKWGSYCLLKRKRSA